MTDTPKPPLVRIAVQCVRSHQVDDLSDQLAEQFDECLSVMIVGDSVPTVRTPDSHTGIDVIHGMVAAIDPAFTAAINARATELAAAACEQAMGVAAERNDERTERLAAEALPAETIVEGQKRKWSDEHKGYFTGLTTRVLEATTYWPQAHFHEVVSDGPRKSKRWIAEDGDALANSTPVDEPSTDDTELATAVQAQANVEIGELKARIEGLDAAISAAFCAANRPNVDNERALTDVRSILDGVTTPAKPIVRTQDNVQVGDVRRDRGGDHMRIDYICPDADDDQVTASWRSREKRITCTFEMKSVAEWRLLNPTDEHGNPLPKEAADASA